MAREDLGRWEGDCRYYELMGPLGGEIKTLVWGKVKIPLWRVLFNLSWPVYSRKISINIKPSHKVDQ